MFEIICVTQSSLCGENFLSQIEKICIAKVDRIILREKHLSESEYFILAEKVQHICKEYEVPLTFHTFHKTAVELNAESFHCTYSMLKSEKIPDTLRNIGVSVHSVEEADDVENLGADYITAGHIFETKCKSGVKPRGIDFIKDICQSVNIPVYAIGGITPQNVSLLKNTGIKGICLMSSLMTAPNPTEYLKSFL